MDSDGKKESPDRVETDASLHAERQKTDEELIRRRGKDEADADEVVRVARQRADAVLRHARGREDERPKGFADSQRVDTERGYADAILAEERRVADDTLEGERQRRLLALVGLLAKEREATDLRLLLERVAADRALTARDEFLALVSHDLRSDLATIALNAQMLRRLSERDAPIRTADPHLHSIEKITAQMARLVADLLDVASIEAGKLIVVTRRADVGALLRDAVDAVKPAAAAARLELALDVPEGTLDAGIDGDRMLQVLSNLLGNALKFTPPGGRVTVRGWRAGEQVRVAISDTGEGIPADRLEAIFDRFEQGTRRDRRGLGLGLYIARRIIEAHGGTLWAESTVGQGSTFSFALPV